MNSKRIFGVLLLIGIWLSACSSGKVAPPDNKDVPEATPTPLYLSEIVDQGEGGEQTRVFIYIDEDGAVMAGSEEAGYRYGIQFQPSANLFSASGGSMMPTYWLAGAEHVYEGKINLSIMTFESDSRYPLTFKLIKDQGFLYMCGRGTITREDGSVIEVGQEDTIQTWMPWLGAEDIILREAAAQALGWLAVTAEEKEQVVPLLISALEDSAWEVRRNAAEALGRIQDQQAAEALLKHTLSSGESDEWVRAVAAEAYTAITGIQVTLEATETPEGMVLEATATPEPTLTPLPTATPEPFPINIAWITDDPEFFSLEEVHTAMSEYLFERGLIASWEVYAPDSEELRSRMENPADLHVAFLMSGVPPEDISASLREWMEADGIVFAFDGAWHTTWRNAALFGGLVTGAEVGWEPPEDVQGVVPGDSVEPSTQSHPTARGILDPLKLSRYHTAVSNDRGVIEYAYLTIFERDRGADIVRLLKAKKVGEAVLPPQTDLPPKDITVGIAKPAGSGLAVILPQLDAADEQVQRYFANLIQWGLLSERPGAVEEPISSPTVEEPGSLETPTSYAQGEDVGSDPIQELDMLYSLEDMAFSPDGSQLATMSCDWPTQGEGCIFKLRTWALSTRALEQSTTLDLANSDWRWSRLAWSPDGTQITIAICNEVDPTNLLFCNSVKVDRWDLLTGQLSNLIKIQATNSRTLELTISPHGELLALPVCLDRVDDSDCLDIEIQLWDISKKTQLFTWHGYQGWMYLTFSPDARYLATSPGEDIWIWDTQTGERALTIDNKEDSTATAWSADGILAVPFCVGVPDYCSATEIWLWDTKTDSLVTTFETPLIYLNDLEWTADGDQLILTGCLKEDEENNCLERNIYFCDVGKRQVTADLVGDVWEMAVSPDGVHAAWFMDTVEIINLDDYSNSR